MTLGPRMSAFGGKADIPDRGTDVYLFAKADVEDRTLIG